MGRSFIVAAITLLGEACVVVAVALALVTAVALVVSCSDDGDRRMSCEVWLDNASDQKPGASGVGV